MCKKRFVVIVVLLVVNYNQMCIHPELLGLSESSFFMSSCLRYGSYCRQGAIGPIYEPADMGAVIDLGSMGAVEGEGVTGAAEGMGARGAMAAAVGTARGMVSK